MARRDAARHFVGELESLARAGTATAPRPLVTVILDGENAWEYYPYNGYFFLNDLYERLAAHPSIRPCTMREWLGWRDAALAAGEPDPCGELPRLVAGSWVYGDLTTWIGAPDKNRAWDLLCEAKDSVRRGRSPRAVSIGAQVAGDAPARRLRKLGLVLVVRRLQPRGGGRALRSLFRRNLRPLPAPLAMPPPPALDDPISVGGGAPEAGGAMRRAQQVA